MIKIITLAVLLCVVPAAFAVTITNGTFVISGNMFVTGMGASPIVTPAGTCPAGDQCIFWQDNSTVPVNDKVDIGATGLPNGNLPAAMAGPDAANIANLQSPPDVVGVAFPNVTFMTFNNAGITTALLLNFIPAGIDGAAGCTSSPPAASQICTPAGSLFNLQNLTASSSTVSFKMSGITNDSTSTWTGTFTSQFNSIPFQTILTNLGTAGYVSNSISGNITLALPVTTPEPGTWMSMLTGGGLLMLGTFIRRRRRS